MLQTETQVQEYAKIHSDLLSGAQNLVEFASTLPAPDENGTVRNVSPQQLNELRVAHQIFAEVWEAIGDFQEATSGSHRVTVSLEPAFEHGACWVARDSKGRWKTYCKEHFAKTAVEAVAMMYHACEVVSVQADGEKAKARILN